MGGEFQMRVVKGKTMKEIEATWDSLVEMDLYENGHEYSGSIGMLGKNFDIAHVIVDTEEQAEEFLNENHDKWNCALAIKVRSQKEGEIVMAIGGWCAR